MYVIPYVEKYFENYNEYNVGDTIEYSNNGVNRWVVAGKEVWNSSSLVLIPETPIELVIEGTDDNIGQKANQIIQSFYNDVYRYGKYVNIFGTGNLPNLIQNFLNQQTERIIFDTGPFYFKSGNVIKFMYASIYYYENGKFVQFGENCNSNECAATLYTEQGPWTLGYRPVVTLKVKEELQDKDKKEISSKLQVGDNVKYEAKGYKNWKVLSIDNNLGTVDIISGGIVKNITLSGKEDWDNYEDIIQREVDQYKNGDKAKKATTVTSKDLKTLKEIDESLLSRYWLLNKYQHKGSHAYIKSVKFIDYNISTIYLYKYDNYEMNLDNISLYTDIVDEEGQDRYKNEISRHAYTAGLRPVITLKLDSVEKLNEDETKKIEESTTKQEKIYLKEQESKNKNYKGPKIVDDTSSKGTKKYEKDNNTNIIDNDNNNETKVVEKIVYKDNLINKYGFIITSITTLLELVIIIAMYLKFRTK